MASAGSIHVPPQAMTLGRRKKSFRFAAFTPPVGTKRTFLNGPYRPFSMAMPPEAAAGKNFITSMPYSRTFCTSEAVLTPGRTGTLCSRHQRTTGSLMPGVTI